MIELLRRRANFKKARLPYGYQEVEYLQSSGTQWIDTGYALNSSDKVEARAKFLRYEPSSAYIFGRWGGNANFGINANGGNSHCVFYNASHQFTPGFQLNTVYDVIMSNGLLKVNGQNASYTPNATFIGNASAYLFWANGTSQAKQPLCIYYAKFSNSSNSLIRNFVPAYRKSDNKPGMYDLVSGTFFTNKGTGEFTVGPDVN